MMRSRSLKFERSWANRKQRESERGKLGENQIPRPRGVTAVGAKIIVKNANSTFYWTIRICDTSGTGYDMGSFCLIRTSLAMWVGGSTLHRDINCVGLAPDLPDGIMARGRTTCALHLLCVHLQHQLSKLITIYQDYMYVFQRGF